MVSAVISRVAIIVGGMLYPAYRSFKAVRTKDTREYVKWMMYWIVFALFCALETFADIFIAFWCPFYSELKILFVFYLLSPYTKGASVLYRRFVHPLLMKHEADIDILLDQAKSDSYHTVMRLGSQTVLAAREVVTNMALKSMARSHSLDDLSGRTRAALPASRSRGGTGVTVQEIIEEDEVVEMHDDQYDGVVRGRTSRRLISNGEAAYGDEDFVELVGDDDDVTDPTYAPNKAQVTKTIRASAARQAGARAAQRAVYQPGSAVHAGYGTLNAGRMTTRATARHSPVTANTYDAPY